MRDCNRDIVRLADEVMAEVSTIVDRPEGAKAKLSALCRLTARLSRAGEKFRVKYEKAKARGDVRLETSMKKKWESVQTAIRYVSAKAKGMLAKRRCLGFSFEPSHFATPHWER